jgi:precorrin-6B methylase 2
LRIRYLSRSTLQSLRRNGFCGTLQLVWKYVGSTLFPVQSDEVVRRFRLGQSLSQTLDHTVAYGPFTGLRLSDTSWWGAADRGSMLLGIYEKEVLEVLESLSHDRETFIDVGAADGYYAAGAVASGQFDRAICFELSEEGQAAIIDNATRNNVLERVHVLGEATSETVGALEQQFSIDLSRTVFLIDIEGAEFELLTEKFMQQVKSAALIVEIHDWEKGSASAVTDLVDRALEIFSVDWITTGARDMSQFPELSEWPDDDRWILCSESRRKLMSWLVFRPL